jgi:hypothetical protein
MEQESQKQVEGVIEDYTQIIELLKHSNLGISPDLINGFIKINEMLKKAVKEGGKEETDTEKEAELLIREVLDANGILAKSFDEMLGFATPNTKVVRSEELIITEIKERLSIINEQFGRILRLLSSVQKLNLIGSEKAALKQAIEQLFRVLDAFSNGMLKYGELYSKVLESNNQEQVMLTQRYVNLLLAIVVNLQSNSRTIQEISKLVDILNSQFGLQITNFIPTFFERITVLNANLQKMQPKKPDVVIKKPSDSEILSALKELKKIFIEHKKICEENLKTQLIDKKDLWEIQNDLDKIICLIENQEKPANLNDRSKNQDIQRALEEMKKYSDALQKLNETGRNILTKERAELVKMMAAIRAEYEKLQSITDEKLNSVDISLKEKIKHVKDNYTSKIWNEIIKIRDLKRVLLEVEEKQLHTPIENLIKKIEKMKIPLVRTTSENQRINQIFSEFEKEIDQIKKEIIQLTNPLKNRYVGENRDLNIPIISTLIEELMKDLQGLINEIDKIIESIEGTSSKKTIPHVNDPAINDLVSGRWNGTKQPITPQPGMIKERNTIQLPEKTPHNNWYNG